PRRLCASAGWAAPVESTSRAARTIQLCGETRRIPVARCRASIVTPRGAAAAKAGDVVDRALAFERNPFQGAEIRAEWHTSFRDRACSTRIATRRGTVFSRYMLRAREFAARMACSQAAEAGRAGVLHGTHERFAQARCLSSGGGLGG